MLDIQSFIVLRMFCEMVKKDNFWQIRWEAITITFALNDDLSMVNKPYHRLLRRYVHRKHNKPAFQHYTIAPTKYFIDVT